MNLPPEYPLDTVVLGPHVREPKINFTPDQVEGPCCIYCGTPWRLYNYCLIHVGYHEFGECRPRAAGPRKRRAVAQ